MYLQLKWGIMIHSGLLNFFFFFSSRRRHTRLTCHWSSDVCSSDLAGDNPPGDALIEIKVLPHPYFVRKGDDIHLDLPISLKEGVLGAKLKVPTVSGAVAVSVPKWSSSGRVLRIKGRGVPRADGGRGDQYVTLKLALPKKPDPDLERFVSGWQPSDSPRQSMRV